MFEVFTTVLVINGKPLWLEKHLERLELHARLSNIDPLPILQKQNLPLPKGEGKYLMRVAINQQGYQITTRPCQPTPAEADVYISNQIATNQIKTNQREVYDLAYEQARSKNAFEGLLCNREGYLVDGCRSSLLILKDKTLTLLEGGIEGITRQQVALKAQKLGFEIKRAYLKPHQLDGQLFLAGTGVGLVPVRLVK